MPGAFRVIDDIREIGGLTTAGALARYNSGTGFFEESKVFDVAGKIGVDEASPGAKFHVHVKNAAVIGQIIEAEASQSANLSEWQDSSKVRFAFVDPVGNIAAGDGWTSGSTAARLTATGKLELRDNAKSATNIVSLEVGATGTSLVSNRFIAAPEFRSGQTADDARIVMQTSPPRSMAFLIKAAAVTVEDLVSGTMASFKSASPGDITFTPVFSGGIVYAQNAAFGLTDGIAAPTATAGRAKLYVHTTDGRLKIIYGDSDVRVLDNVIGTDVQAWDAGLDDIAGLAVTDGNIIVGDGANWTAESGATARTSLGLGTGAAVVFTSLEVSNFLFLTGSGSPRQFSINSTDVQERVTRIETNEVIRWDYGGDSTAEGGSDAGTDLVFRRYSDAGALLGTALKITRSSGLATFGAAITAGGNITTTGGKVQINRAGDAAAATMNYYADAGQLRGVNALTGSTLRWSIFFADSSTESGSDAGSNLRFARYSDAGVGLGNVFQLIRSSGKAIFEAEVEIDGALNHDGTTVGLYGVAPTAQASHIADPSGGGTQDAEARTAINAILVAIENLGVTAAA